MIRKLNIVEAILQKTFDELVQKSRQLQKPCTITLDEPETLVFSHKLYRDQLVELIVAELRKRHVRGSRIVNISGTRRPILRFLPGQPNALRFEFSGGTNRAA